MRIGWPWRRSAEETGEGQLARLAACAQLTPVPAGPEASLPAQLERLRSILDLVQYYLYPRPGPLHADVAARVGSPERPLTPRRVALLHEADPAYLADATTEELAQIAGFALREPARLARDPEAVAAAASNLDVLHAAAMARRYLGALPAVRPDPELGTCGGAHAYAAALRWEVRRRYPEAVEEHPRLNWGRRGDGPPGPPPPPVPVPRADVLDEVARMLPLLCMDGRPPGAGVLTADALPSGEALAERARELNGGEGFRYRFRGSIGSADWPIYLADGELEEVLRGVAAERVRREG